MDPSHPESPESVAARLLAIRLGYEKSQPEMRIIVGGAGESQWSQWETAYKQRVISLCAAKKLYHEWGIPLDYVYMGVKTALPDSVRETIRTGERLAAIQKAAAAAKAAAKKKGRRRKVA